MKSEKMLAVKIIEIDRQQSLELSRTVCALPHIYARYHLWVIGFHPEAKLAPIWSFGYLSLMQDPTFG